MTLRRISKIFSVILFLGFEKRLKKMFRRIFAALKIRKKCLFRNGDSVAFRRCENLHRVCECEKTRQSGRDKTEERAKKRELEKFVWNIGKVGSVSTSLEWIPADRSNRDVYTQVTYSFCGSVSLSPCPVAPGGVIR